MKSYYLAVDIGASSGRHMLGSVEHGAIQLEEVYRFENKLVNQNGTLCWQLDVLFEEIRKGMQACAQQNKIPRSMGIDTWGVDFVLLDGKDRLLGETVGYRDSRTKGMDQLVFAKIPEEELYERTGIQKQPFNTIYQLCAIQQQHPEQLSQAQRLLMVPEYFDFLLTGEKVSEYTNATTTNLVHAETKNWDEELIERLCLPKRLFGTLHLPGTVVGSLLPEIRDRVGFDCQVVLPATHDTGSAVLAMPAEEENALYISSGTWSLMGVERMRPDCSERSRRWNFTNEGGYQYRYRYLKNIMGLWMIQSARKELDRRYSFDELCTLAQQAEGFPARVDVNDPCFLAPASMCEEIKRYCLRTGQPVPESVGELFCCIYHSLAHSYGETVRELEEITGRRYSELYIIGGGSKDAYLNALTARYTGKAVSAGPAEATALGNLLAQMIKDGVFSDVQEARRAVRSSFAIQRNQK